MSDDLDQLLRELTVERFRTTSRRPPPAPRPMVQAGDLDGHAAVVERRRVLAEALDGVHLVPAAEARPRRVA